MTFDKDLIAGKLRRWEGYLNNYRLPAWNEIPDIGLYMEQVIALLKEYLDYLPPELKEEQFITATTINNYVRKKVMPEPIKKKYYRRHIAYLIIICTLKHCLSIATLQTVIPVGLETEELERTYTAYVNRHQIACGYFVKQVRSAAAGILDHEPDSELSTDSTEDIIISSAIISGFSRLLAEKLLLLDSRTLEDGGDILIKTSKDANNNNQQ
ncbi:MAG: DUF1836 domain-containing protein [Clostridia bacterium]|nr:DUF1836 domain-containing protein [Clostridia bacterium]